MRYFLSITLFLGAIMGLFSQNSTTITASLDVQKDSLSISQTLRFENTSKASITEIYLSDWANSFSSKQTALARRFAENYEKKFHLAKEEERGSTHIKAIQSAGTFLQFDRPKEHTDVLRIYLNTPLKAGEFVNLRLEYGVKIPSSKFTRYGARRNKEYNLRYWHLVPAVLTKEGWSYYSNKNLDDLFTAPYDVNINLSVPDTYALFSDLEIDKTQASFIAGQSLYRLTGKNKTTTRLFLRLSTTYFYTQTDEFTLQTNLRDANVPLEVEAIIIDRLGRFIKNELGPFNLDKLVVSDLDYRDNPVYGLSSLPDFIQPFPDGFQYEIKIAKSTISKYVDQTILLNPRTDRWLIDGIKVYLLQKYVDTHYPDIKIVGNLYKYWLARQFYASELKFNDQYNFLYMHMARLNLDQPLTTPYDSLIKYNKNIANAYKSGAGLKYLEEYLEDDAVSTAIQSFYEQYRGKVTSSRAFRPILDRIVRTGNDTLSRKRTTDWFFSDYLQTRKKIDYRIKKTKSKGDSLYVTIKNKRDSEMPISLFAYDQDSLSTKLWIDGFKGTKTIALGNKDISKLVLNEDNVAPEYNVRNNYHRPNAFLGLNKPLQFKLFQDIENPSKNQVFFMPVFEFNLYDGFSTGLKMYNKTVLRRGFNYKIEPLYGLRSKTIIGKVSASYRHYLEDSKLFEWILGISANRFSYAPDLFYTRYQPFVRFNFRPDDVRSDVRRGITARFISVRRDRDINIQQEEPNYNVLNVRYSSFNPGIINALNWSTDVQVARNFSKISATLFYRHLYLNNRQINFRFFGGMFLKNDTSGNGDFFSFAVDRPTDYLFDYNYYGRSEGSGLFSQQYIQAEGGFKSFLAPAFANDYLFSVNASTTIWKYIYAYGDLGFVKNRGSIAKTIYDSGIQVSLLDDYFELFFPVYSSNGWEIGQPNYDQKIRFMVTLSFDTFIGLFTRRWY